MLFAKSMKRYMWVASVNLNVKPRTYSEPVLYRVNVLPVSAGADVVANGSRLSEIERARMSRKYGATIKEFDKVWVFDTDSETPVFDMIASTATHVVRAIKNTPQVRMVEIKRLIPYDNGM